jgi:hypothetical protein
MKTSALARTVAPAAKRAKVPATKQVATKHKIESIYRKESLLDQALRLLTRKNGATKEDLTAISWAYGLLYRIRQNYKVVSEGDRGSLVYHVAKQL